MHIRLVGEILSMARREGLAPGSRLTEQRLADTIGVLRSFGVESACRVRIR